MYVNEIQAAKAHVEIYDVTTTSTGGVSTSSTSGVSLNSSTLSSVVPQAHTVIVDTTQSTSKVLTTAVECKVVATAPPSA